MNWKGEGRRCKQREGVSQIVDSAAPPTRTCQERRICLFSKRKGQRLTDPTLKTYCEPLVHVDTKSGFWTVIYSKIKTNRCRKLTVDSTKVRKQKVAFSIYRIQLF